MAAAEETRAPAGPAKCGGDLDQQAGFADAARPVIKPPGRGLRGVAAPGEAPGQGTARVLERHRRIASLQKLRGQDFVVIVFQPVLLRIQRRRTIAEARVGM